ncbi:hypothetical protein [Burkholderia cepacia]|uniref:hypothetical protein n=1 Tax=Burkholderia cepacia TaxID=292 RepID=UPI0004F74EE5|nr:hypothetical protein [Burkholderia cepacia]AIO29307.1 hypothetical protein DM41_6161 [Burkholderia cepacia ATCC 25416]MCA8464306.1 hypothetical protein [Burkholderia cepacia]MDN7761128.1 hypothetical protein [Burkholderia cepacia]QCY06865.1 hypothetical protein EJ998_28175 [Burkholderia cepacia ATCC 25416]SPU75803.1 Uncharacterised protein [Burkholderia cepacia]
MPTRKQRARKLGIPIDQLPDGRGKNPSSWNNTKRGSDHHRWNNGRMLGNDGFWKNAGGPISNEDHRQHDPADGRFVNKHATGHELDVPAHDKFPTAQS